MTLTLPPLAAPSGIQPQNVLAAGVIYAAYELEQLKSFAVLDRIVEQFQRGALPISRTSAGQALTRYIQNGPNRLSATERGAVYARALGKGGDQQGTIVNRDFDRLWARFLSAVGAHARASRRRVDIRKAGRDLASNLSLYGYGIGYFAAKELQDQIAEVAKVLSLADVRAAYDARDMWQVIDRVAASELGGARNAARHRTLATSGLEIIRWLAASGRSRPQTGVPSCALVKACEAWLGANGDGGDHG
jgi:hypothetical protein